MPVNPYEEQISFIEMFQSQLKYEGKNIYLSSATGTGKTLSLLCGVFSLLAEMNKGLKDKGLKDKDLKDKNKDKNECKGKYKSFTS